MDFSSLTGQPGGVAEAVIASMTFDSQRHLQELKLIEPLDDRRREVVLTPYGRRVLSPRDAR